MKRKSRVVHVAKGRLPRIKSHIAALTSHPTIYPLPGNLCLVFIRSHFHDQPTDRHHHQSSSYPSWLPSRAPSYLPPSQAFLWPHLSLRSNRSVHNYCPITLASRTFGLVCNVQPQARGAASLTKRFAARGTFATTLSVPTSSSLGTTSHTRQKRRVSRIASPRQMVKKLLTGHGKVWFLGWSGGSTAVILMIVACSVLAK